jgi:anti-sigma factor RsiW
MTCQEFQHHYVYAFIDGTLDAQARADSKRHLHQCAHCRASVEAIRGVEDQLRAVWREEPVPDALWPRIQARLDRTALAPPGEDQKRRGVLWPWLAAAAAMMVLGLSVLQLGSLFPSTATRQARLLSVPVDDLHTFVVSQRPLDVADTGPASLRTWFQTKVSFSPPVLPDQVEEAKLVGGRLCHFLNRRVASFMYETDGRYVSVYVMPRQGLPLPSGEGVDLHRVRATVHNVQGYTHLIWSQTGLLYSLVSDLPQDRSLRMAQAIAQAGWAHRRRETEALNPEGV